MPLPVPPSLQPWPRFNAARTVHLRLPVPPGVALEVRCRNRVHRIRFAAGRLTFCDHHLPDLAFEVAMHPDRLCRCATIFKSLRTGAGCRTDLHVPKPLRDALWAWTRHRTRLGHGREKMACATGEALRIALRDQAAWRVATPLLRALQARGFRATVQCQIVLAGTLPQFVITPLGTAQFLTLYHLRQRCWAPLQPPTVAQTTKAHPRTGTAAPCCGAQFACHLCQQAVHSGERFRRHIRSSHHWNAVKQLCEDVNAAFAVPGRHG